MAIGLSLAPQKRVYGAFFVYSFGLGGIYPRLGDIQLGMGIREGALGAALIGLALGTQISLMFAGPLLDRFGYRNCLLTGIPLIAVGLAAASLAPDPFIFFACLLFSGLMMGAVEVVVNVEADRTEHLLDRRIMSRCHAFWSFGFFSAGAVGVLAKGIGLSPQLHLWLMVPVIALASLLLLGRFTPAPARVASEAPRPIFVLPTPPILVLVLFTFSAMLLEGAGADWSVIFMRDTFDAANWVNGTAFAIGALAQALARFFADGFVDRHGPVNVARTLILTLFTGVLLVSFAQFPAMALLGFALMGIGTSAIFPLAISAAAQRTDRPAAVNVAAVAQLSFIVFLIAPPLLGFVAQHYGIRYSFGIGIPMAILSWFTLNVLSPEPQGKKANA